jgi:hypothetical protein
MMRRKVMANRDGWGLGDGMVNDVEKSYGE